VKAAVEALRENPGWARQSKEWLKVALWGFRYTEEVPTRDDIAKALISAQASRAKLPASQPAQAREEREAKAPAKAGEYLFA
jgi:hypothetical protein